MTSINCFFTLGRKVSECTTLMTADRIILVSEILDMIVCQILLSRLFPQFQTSYHGMAHLWNFSATAISLLQLYLMAVAKRLHRY
jgi:hypothetical protein